MALKIEIINPDGSPRDQAVVTDGQWYRVSFRDVGNNDVGGIDVQGKLVGGTIHKRTPVHLPCIDFSSSRHPDRLMTRYKLVIPGGYAVFSVVNEPGDGPYLNFVPENLLV